MTVRDDFDSDLLPLAFALHSSPGAYALLLGSGVSAPSGIPTAWGVLEELTGRVAKLAGADTEDPVAWFRQATGAPVDYGVVLERLAPTRLERQRLLREFFEPDGQVARPTPAHEAIARLARAGTIRVVVTLNFDRLIEQAIRAEGIEPTVISSPADIRGMAPLHTIDCCVVHLHGDYLNPESMLNTDGELSGYDEHVQRLLDRVVEDYGLIIAGWSATWDVALRDTIAARYPGRMSLTWVEPHGLGDEGTKLLTSKRAALVTLDADTAFGAIADAVESLRTREARHPLTVPVAIETAKRGLSGGRTAIPVHDLLGREFTRLHAHRDFHLADYNSADPYGGWPTMEARILAAAEVPCVLTAALAYWGDQQSDRWWLDELPRFAVRANASGLVKLIEARYVAGHALLWAAGVASVAAGRYGTLKRLLSLEVREPYHHEHIPLARLLYESHAPRLHPYLSPLLVDALGLPPEAVEDAWQRFEILRLALDLLSRRGAELDSARQTATALDEARLNHHLGQTQVTEAAVERAQEKHAAAMEPLISAVRVGSPHVLVEDERMDDRYPSPVAINLIREVTTQGEASELNRAALAAYADLPIALRAVNGALGGRGERLAYSGLSKGISEVPSRLWLDEPTTS